MKAMRWIFGIFFLAGLGMLIGGFVRTQHTRQFIANAVTAQGTVVENILKTSTDSDGRSSWAYYPHVRYRIEDGRDLDFISSTGASPPSYRVGQPVVVLYDPQDPAHASINSFGSLWGISLLLMGLGVFFTGPAIGFAIWKRASDRKSAWLEANGRRIVAEFTRVELNTSLQVNGRNPYRIQCQWLDLSRNEVHIFHSGNLWFDPTQFVQQKTLIVLMDPDNPHRYEVDTSFLPKVV